MINRFIYKIIVFTVIFFLFSYVMAENLEYVDLGLSVKWANMNVGASKITDFGNYYAWAETSTKEQYDWTTYKYTEKGATRMTKYNSTSMGAVLDFLTELEPIDDAATINWGNDWRMPSLSEMNELIQNCTWTWYENYNGSGNSGFVITSKIVGYTNNSIFLPAAGHYGGKNTYDLNQMGMYWTSTLDKNSYANIKACQLYFGDGSLQTMSYDREIGMTIRPVYGPRQEEPKDYDISGNVQGHDYVDLGLSVQWATCNIGSDQPKQGGNLYSWAETEIKEKYTIENYKYGKESNYSAMTKYNKEDGLTVLESIDDAATVNWGDEWRTPTAVEFSELIDNCDWYSGNHCLYGISKINQNVIIISRSTGCRDDSFYGNRTDDGYYWTANKGQDVQRGYAWLFRAGYHYSTTNINRYFGYAVRPVLSTIHENTAIDQVKDKPSYNKHNGVFIENGKVVIKNNGSLFNLNGIKIK